MTVLDNSAQYTILKNEGMLVLAAPSQHSCSKHQANLARAQSTEAVMLVLKVPS